MEHFAKGVDIGVENELPRTPAIFERKCKWTLAEEEVQRGEELWASNYASVAEKPEALQKQFGEDEGTGWMMRMELKDIRKKYGRRLCVAALRALLKDLNGDDFQIIFDGTHFTKVNNRIRVRDMLRMPGWDDMLVIQKQIAVRGLPRFSLLFDVKSAHRLVAVREEDWAYLACQAGDASPHDEEAMLWLSLVGTFGVASAAYWWARPGGSGFRLLFYMFFSTACSTSCFSQMTAR